MGSDANRMRYTIVAYLSLFFGGTSSATTILVWVSPQEAIVAADSLATTDKGTEWVCKIHYVSEHMLFAVSGAGRNEQPPFDPWVAAKISSKDSVGPHEAAEKYARDAEPILQRIWIGMRALYIEMGMTRGPQDFVFVGLDRAGVITASVGSFVEDVNRAPRVQLKKQDDLRGDQADRGFILRMGKTENVPSSAKIQEMARSVGVAEAFKWAIAEQMKATPESVGGDISIVKLNRDGSVTWVNRGACQK